VTRLGSRVSLVACVVVALAAAAWSIDAIWWAYGSGPPFYGRTTNMDKWEDPLPVLLAVDVVVGIVVALCARRAWRALRRDRR